MGYSFRSMEKDSLNLIGVLSYLEPDVISEDISQDINSRECSKESEFCKDEFA